MGYLEQILMKELSIKGTDKKVLLDDEDFERIASFNWKITDSRNDGTGLTIRWFSAVGKRWTPIANIVLFKHKGLMIDHKDRNPFNNQKDNLRISSHSQNNQNKGKQRNSSSKYKGVTLHKRLQKFQVSIMLNGKSKFLGTFTDEIEAAKVYDKHAKIMFGEFAYLNFP